MNRDGSVPQVEARRLLGRGHITPILGNIINPTKTGNRTAIPLAGAILTGAVMPDSMIHP